nr:MAG TPA: hypothetical protein [Caudoviricetes sp.]
MRGPRVVGEVGGVALRRRFRRGSPRRWGLW